MKIISNTSVLTSIIGKVSKAVGKKVNMPILQNILFCERNGEHYLVCSNSDQWVEHRIEFAQVEGTWHDFCLPLGSATNAIALLPDQAISIDVENEDKNDSYGVKFSTSDGNGKQTTFNCLAEPAENYPRWAASEGADYSIPASFLLSSMKEAMKYAAKDELRPVMNGVYLDLYQDKLVVVASDGHILYKNVLDKEIDGIGQDEHRSVDVPVTVVSLLASCVANGEENIGLSFTEKRIVFHTSVATVMSLVFAGRYPNYDSVIPENNRVAVLPKQELMMNAKLVRNFASVASDALRLDFDGGMLMEMSAEDIDFAVDAKSAVTIVDSSNLGNLAILVKASSFMRCISDIQTENVKLKFTDSMRAITIHEDGEDSNLLLLLMPLAMND